MRDEAKIELLKDVLLNLEFASNSLITLATDDKSFKSYIDQISKLKHKITEAIYQIQDF